MGVSHEFSKFDADDTRQKRFWIQYDTLAYGAPVFIADLPTIEFFYHLSILNKSFGTLIFNKINDAHYDGQYYADFDANGKVPEARLCQLIIFAFAS